jgi:hypothetical protein
MVNGDMLLQDVLPDAVSERRRELRQRLQSLREPIRSRREQFVPGPDVVGSVEERLMDLRSQVTQRENILERIRERRADSGMGGSGSGGNGGSGQPRSAEQQSDNNTQFQ